VTGAAEPWDAESPYYFVSLFVAGAVVGFLCPRTIWAAFVGIVVGQLIYLLVFVPLGPLLPLGLLFLVGYALLSLLGAALASRLRSPRGAKRTD
jgi:ABC-type Na+ efflux pump permease subunit